MNSPDSKSQSQGLSPNDASVEHAYEVLRGHAPAAANAERLEFAADVDVGLSRSPKRLSSRFFYDDEGSRLFREITSLDDYYLTAAERDVLRTHGRAMVEQIGADKIDLIDLGAGDGHKTRILLDIFAEAGVDVRYVPIDISEGAMASLLADASEHLTHLPLLGIVGEYFPALAWLSQHTDRRKLACFLGSNIGNFDLPGAHGFLVRLRQSLRPGDFALVGFDLKKEVERMVAAYSDSSGVTARFNLNLLTRINRELGGHFDLSQFAHYATYDVERGAMVSFLLSRVSQEVRIDSLHRSFHFEPWEAIHTEASGKYLPSDIHALARRSGFSDVALYNDSQQLFCDALWEIRDVGR